LQQLERSGLGAGALSPFLSFGGADDLSGVDGVRAAVALPGTELVATFAHDQVYTAAGRALFERLKRATDAPVGGPPGQSADFVDAVYGNFPLMIVLVSVLTLVLLARAFRSILLPLKAVVLNLLSVAAAWGVMVLVWQEGYGSERIWGIEPTGAIVEFIPLMVFAFLFGLSMDYEVFILSRVREEYDRLDRAGDGGGSRTDGAPRDERGAHPVPELRRARLRARGVPQGVRDGARRRDPPRRDRRADAACAVARRAVRPLELVASRSAARVLRVDASEPVPETPPALARAE